MGAPTTKGFKLFLRNIRFSDMEMLQQIEARREFLSDQLDSMTLPELGRFKFLSGDGGDHDLYQDKPEVIDGNLRIQGSFYEAWNAREPEIIWLWGLLRSGEWATIQVEYEQRGGIKRMYKQAKRATVKLTTLQELLTVCQVMPETVWIKLSEIAKDLVKYRKRLYEQAVEIEHAFEIEDTMLSAIGEIIRKREGAAAT